MERGFAHGGRTLRVAIWLLVAVAAVVIGLGSADGRLAHWSNGTCAGGLYSSINSVVADNERVYIGRDDGVVVAVNRASGAQVWTYAASATPGNYQIVNVDYDSTSVYVTEITAAENTIGSVVAFDKATGEEQWRSYNLEAEPTRAMVDGTYVYVGNQLGAVHKLHKGSGIAVTDPGTGQPLIFRGLPDGILPHYAGAMDMVGGWLWVAHNFPEYPEREHNPVGFTNLHYDNKFMRINPDTMTGAEFTFSPVWGEDDVGADLFPSIHGIWGDSSNNLYFSVIHAQGFPWAPDDPSDGGIIHFFTTDAPAGTAFAPRAFRPLGLNFTIGPIIGGTTWTALGIGGIPASVGGDDANVYVAVTQTEAPDGKDSGAVLKLSRYSAANPSSSLTTAGWDRPDTVRDGRFPGSGQGRSIFVDAATNGKVIVGHSCYLTPQDRQELGKNGALTIEVPKDEGPTVNIIQPRSGEFLPGRGTVAVRTDWPQAPAGGTLRAEFYVSQVSGNCADGASCYERLSPQPSISLIPANGYFTWVDFQFPLNEGNNYRLKVVVSDPNLPSRFYADTGESDFVIDKTLPEIFRVTPEPGTVLRENGIYITVIASDPGSDIDRKATAACINVGRGGSCASAGEMESGGIFNYMFFRNNGFDANLSRVFGYFAEGPHRLEVRVYDRAGNVATQAWDIRIDSTIASPSRPCSPAREPDGSPAWVNDVRPIFSCQFFEQASPLEARFNGLDVTSRLKIIEQDPLNNPMGTRIEFQETTALNEAITHDFSLRVYDESGNPGGPYSTSLRIDAGRPVFSNQFPEPGSLLTENRPVVRFAVSDTGSGIRMTSISAFLDGKDFSTKIDTSQAGLVTFRTDVPLKEGRHTVNIAVVDQAGNLAVSEWSFSVDLTAPTVKVTTVLPGDQLSVKAGDKVVVRVTVTDASAIRSGSVRVNAKELDPTISAAVGPTPLAGQRNVYELEVQVREARSRIATVSATAEDVGGLSGFKNTTVLIDNLPPRTELKPLSPLTVEDEFNLQWENKPKDLPQESLGIAYYRVERRENEGEWKVIRPRVNGTSVALSFPEAEFTRLQFRVTAVDFAGNVETVPSNVVETVIPGDPFEQVNYEKVLTLDSEHKFSATPKERLSLSGATVFLTLTSADNKSAKQDLEPFGRFYTASWNLSDLGPGDYVLQFFFRSKEATQPLHSKAYPVKIAAASTEGDGGDAGRDRNLVPGAGLAVPLLAAAVAVVARRSRDRRGGAAR